MVVKSLQIRLSKGLELIYETYRGDQMPEESLENSDDADQAISDQSGLARKRIKHLLIGNPALVKSTIQNLHKLGYVQVNNWSKPVAAGELGRDGEVISVLIRYVTPNM